MKDSIKKIWQRSMCFFLAMITVLSLCPERKVRESLLRKGFPYLFFHIACSSRIFAILSYLLG